MNQNRFVKICKQIGKNKNLVQGGGGNISLKISKNEMIVKASGIELEKVSTKKGIAKIDFKKIAKFIESAAKKNLYSEEKYVKAIRESTFENKKTWPSMETGFHAILGKAVIHTHPITINTLTCEKNGKTLLKQALGKMSFEWIPFKNPGIELSIEILRRTRKNSMKNKTRVIFLKNHGLIVSSNSLEKCRQKTLAIESKILKFLKQAKKIKPILFTNLSINEAENLNYTVKVAENFNLKKQEKYFKKFLFPDSVVYYENGFSLSENKTKTIIIKKDKKITIMEKNPAKRKRILETALAHLCIMHNILQFGTPVFLKQKNVNKIKRMKLEKIRKAISQ